VSTRNQSAAWAALSSHAKIMSGVHLRQLFAEDPRRGERIAFAQERAEWARQLAESIDGNIREVWNGGDDVAMIVLAGGGAPYVADYLAERFPHVVRPPADSWLLNCEGGFRYGRFMQILEEQGA